MKKILSIIVPVYNAELFLDKCVGSILEALRPGMDVILVNDGSTDKSGEICDRYAKNYENIKVLHRENGGVTSARKIGTLESDAEFVTYVDSDDWIEPDMYEKMMEVVEEYNVDIVVSNIFREEENRQVVLKSNVEWGFYDREALKKQVFPIMLFDYRLGGSGIAPSLCNKIFKRSIIEKVLDSVDSKIYYGEDALCTFPAFLDAESMYFMDSCFYHYRHNLSSVTCVYDSMLIGRILKLYEELKKHFEERNYYDDKQLMGYVASSFVFFVRKEFLYNKALNVKKRIRKIDELLENSIIRAAVKTTYENTEDANRKLKLQLLAEKKLKTLFWSVYFKDIIRRRKGEKYDN